MVGTLRTQVSIPSNHVKVAHASNPSAVGSQADPRDLLASHHWVSSIFKERACLQNKVEINRRHLTSTSLKGWSTTPWASILGCTRRESVQHGPFIAPLLQAEKPTCLPAWRSHCLDIPTTRVCTLEFCIFSFLRCVCQISRSQQSKK